jgi:hypothetical protein
VGLVVSFDFLINDPESVFLLLPDIVFTSSRLGDGRSTQLESVILFCGFKVLSIHDLVQASDFLGEAASVVRSVFLGGMESSLFLEHWGRLANRLRSTAFDNFLNGDMLVLSEEDYFWKRFFNKTVLRS